MSEYSISIENGAVTLKELFPLYAEHYREMQGRLASDGVNIGPFNPRIDEYVKAWLAGHLINYVVRLDGQAVGYSNIYLTHDMHNGELIAQEDTIFVSRPHRNGIGVKLAKFVLSDLCSRGVLRVNITPVTDLRVAKIWSRLGFKPVAQVMTYNFGAA